MTRLIELLCVPDPLLGSTDLALAGPVFVNIASILMVSGTRRADESVLTLSSGGRIVVQGDAARIVREIRALVEGNGFGEQRRFGPDASSGL